MHGIFLSQTAFHDNLHDLGFTRKMIQRNAAERDEDARSAWREDIAANFTVEQIVAIDESSKDGRTFFCKYGRSPSDQRPIDLREVFLSWTTAQLTRVKHFERLWKLQGAY
ncbi:hypothetical protein AZE42_09949 [Rhizopogon vesiculosus]|uniref:Winged helix-turn helix domain-containing protein n=1 Tax=Rhizopogon vesiculosus TaxID=180088 RepID=A0A1J8QKI5_9AGAM|nr:hypothetical protein AZE42_09949 [Rhizopogon vesiculosus]